jgi:capsular polysaccharide biosynthesis protein
VTRTLDPRSLAVGAAVAALVAAITIVAAFSAGGDADYQAESAVEVLPVPRDDATFEGFSVLREGQDPVETAAQLVETRPIADAVAVRLRLDDGEEALGRVEARAEPRGRLVRIRARDDAALRAARIANAFADELVRQRSSLFQSELRQTIDSLRAQLANVPAGRRDEPPASEAVRRLTELRRYEGRGDPTVRVAAAATAPKRDAASSRLPILLVGLPLALVLGAAAALLVAEDRWRALLRRDPEAANLRRREARLKARVAEVTTRERDLARRAAAVEQREHELERAQAPEAPAPEPPAVPVAVAVPGAFSVDRLQRLLDEKTGDLSRERREELRSYLESLRPYAHVDGTLPKSFDPLVDEVFGDLLKR